MLHFVRHLGVRNFRTFALTTVGLSKLHRIRSDAAEQNVGSSKGSILFATHPAVFRYIER